MKFTIHLRKNYRTYIFTKFVTRKTENIYVYQELSAGSKQKTYGWLATSWFYFSLYFLSLGTVFPKAGNISSDVKSDFLAVHFAF